MMREIPPAIIHERLELSLYIVEKGVYTSLELIDSIFSHWILSYILTGDVETESAGVRCRARTGDVMLHPPHLPFSEMASGPGIHLWLLFEAAISPNVDLFRLYPVPLVTPLLPSCDFAQTFTLLQHAWRSPESPQRNIQVSALSFHLCSMVLESWQQAGSTPRQEALMTPPDRFVEVITYMSEHLEQKISRDDLAALVHLHPGYLDRAFQGAYGMTPMQMLRDLRLRRASQLLETTDMPLNAIAISCGLGDAGYFSRVFQQRYRQTPGQYRRSVKSAAMDYIPPLSKSATHP
jgi:AraC-like DNA-binding protein